MSTNTADGDGPGTQKTASVGDASNAASTSSSNQYLPPFDKLTGDDNWADWKMLMELYLGELYSCTQQDPPADVLKDRNSAEFKKDLLARQRISFAIDSNLVKYLRGATTAHQTWQRLCQAFEDKGVFKRAALLRKILNLKQTTTLEKFVLDMKDLVSQIDATGKSLDEEVCAVLLFNNCKPEHKSFCQIVERTCQTKLSDGTTTFEFKVVCDEFLREANKIKSQDSVLEDPKPALMARPGKTRGSWRPRGGHNAHNGRRPPPGGHSGYYQKPNNGPSGSASASSGEKTRVYPAYPSCKYCKKTNHPENKCRYKPANNTGQKRTGSADSSADGPPNPKIAKTDGPSARGPPNWFLKMAKLGECSDPNMAEVKEIDALVADYNKNVKFYIDSGAFTSMCPDIDCLHDYVSTPNLPVECAGKQILMTKGTGTLILKDKPNGLDKMYNVTHVPGLTSSLLSVSAIAQNGYDVVFSKDHCERSVIFDETTFPALNSQKSPAPNAAPQPSPSDRFVVAPQPITTNAMVPHNQLLPQATKENESLGPDPPVDTASISTDDHTPPEPELESTHAPKACNSNTLPDTIPTVSTEIELKSINKELRSLRTFVVSSTLNPNPSQ
ncbi:Retrovirus-related Pol polyprotein from transposon TNT 1-94 [Frankliniella fusca]|uniref:Retrovirus-related Pol polyprotein from transposon TNT 1-94 n=1 Tax=Frankliniella fusca TaxID=407009 RepID=A0AAE1GVH0_9NEOP|nr:Retrovirus-related Pol polyprotein from transposon TNT 1-94 [Frankliniella fusca]